MKKTIRHNVFETNSSSIHALCIPNNTDIDILINDLIEYDESWAFYSIYKTISEGNYDQLNNEIKEILESIGFDLNKAIEDDDYVYELLYDNDNRFNSSSGMGGEVTIKKYSIQSLYESYKNLVDDNITINEFISKFNWEKYDLDKLIDVDIDWSRHKTLAYIKTKLEILDSDEWRIDSKFFTMKDGVELHQLLSDYKYKDYMKSEIIKLGCEKVKEEFYEFYKDSKIEETIQKYYPITFEYLKENNII